MLIAIGLSSTMFPWTALVLLVAAVEAQSTLCLGRPVELTLTAAVKPVSYKLECDDGSIPFAATATAPQTVDLSACLNYVATCQFSVSEGADWSLVVSGQVWADGNSTDPSASYCIGPHCPDSTCLDVSLTLRTDEYPGEVAYSLVCDGSTMVWNLPMGELRGDVQMVQDEACVDKGSTCIFTIYDDPYYSDGLTSSRDGQPGYFRVTVGAATLAIYTGLEEYETLEYCFGPDCPVDSNESCDPVFLSLVTDEHPQEIQYSLICDGFYEMYAARGSISKVLGTTIDSACIYLDDSCCQFIMEDSPIYQDGLTSPISGQPGSFSLRTATEEFAYYDGSVGYEKLTYNFGSCS